jgi:hypothetical protein
LCYGFGNGRFENSDEAISEIWAGSQHCFSFKYVVPCFFSERSLYFGFQVFAFQSQSKQKNRKHLIEITSDEYQYNFSNLKQHTSLMRVTM